jgi:hypothetical protein
MVLHVALEAGRVVNRERAERDLRQERDVLVAQLELYGRLVDGADLAELAGVRRVLLVAFELAVRRLLRVGHRLEGSGRRGG